jgi:HAMP domain-containing protein
VISAGLLATSGSTSDTEAILVAVVSAVIIIALLAVLFTLDRTLRSLRDTTDELRRESMRLLGDMRGTVGQANSELERVDGLLGTAESISTTVDSASRLAYLAFSNPIIKMLAFGAGTARAARRLRRRSED